MNSVWLVFLPYGEVKVVDSRSSGFNYCLKYITNEVDEDLKTQVLEELFKSYDKRTNNFFGCDSIDLFVQEYEVMTWENVTENFTRGE